MNDLEIYNEAPIALTMLKLESMVNRHIAEVVTGNGRRTEDLIREMREVIINPDMNGVPVEDLGVYRARFMRQTTPTKAKESND